MGLHQSLEIFRASGTQMAPKDLGQTHTRGQAESLFKKVLPQLGNPTRHLKLEEPITFNLLWGSRQEFMEVDFGSFLPVSSYFVI
jgi:hypothetical protein